MKKIYLCILILTASFILASCAKFASKKEEDYVMTIGSEKISVGEFSIYLFEQKTMFEETGGSDIWDTDFNGVPASEVAKENAYNSVIYVKTACQNADEVSVSLNDDDRAEAQALAEDTFGRMNPDYCSAVGLDMEKTAAVMEEIVLHQKVMDSVTMTYQLSSADYSAYIDDYMAENPDDETPRATLESTLREDYIRLKKDEIYKEQIDTWSENIKTEKNSAVWDNIVITDL
ncbi:MAG: hypothetical protein LUD81_02645 [Clostridiales bacterium]|nr:hypothetical protein [Clostridiales bacterium]